jgi:hypothetical protein
MLKKFENLKNINTFGKPNWLTRLENQKIHEKLIFTFKLNNYENKITFY